MNFKEYLVGSERRRALSYIEGFLVEAFGLGARITPISSEDLTSHLNKVMSGEQSKADRFKMPYIHKGNIVITDEQGKKYDLEALKKLITQRPEDLLQKNEKIVHSGGGSTQYFNIGLPALKGLAVNESTGEFVIVDTCPGAGACKVVCYARKGGYVQWKDSSLSQTKKLNFLLNDPEGFKNALIKQIRNKVKYYSRPKQGGTKVVVRWHDAGDFFSDEYMNLAFDVAKAIPEAEFYAYTKMASVAGADKPKNFIINFSSGATPEQESQVDMKKRKHSVIVPKALFQDMLYRDGDGKLQYEPSKLNDLKQRIAQKYNVDLKTVITYDEMKAKPYKVPLAMAGATEEFGPWNVIVKPGDGDESANRKDVLGTYLLEH